MDSDRIRQTFREFFEERGHLTLPSASLIPAGDPTLLFTSAGMAPLKPYYTGEAAPPSRRLTSVQKCFRATDIDAVGDATHLTFFEMLGNFSIGDYFKRDAISFAWDLVTGPFGLAPERIYVTVHLDDDEAYALWRDHVGIPPERIYRYGDRDNWWGPVGSAGPAGPCSELFYDCGALSELPDGGVHWDGPLRTPDEVTELLAPENVRKYGDEPGGSHPNGSGGRFVEIWNLVFMQFYQDEDGVRVPLSAPGVDTGMGLERIAAVLQGKADRLRNRPVPARRRRRRPAGRPGACERTPPPTAAPSASWRNTPGRRRFSSTTAPRRPAANGATRCAASSAGPSATAATWVWSPPFWARSWTPSCPPTPPPGRTWPPTATTSGKSWRRRKSGSGTASGAAGPCWKKP